MATTKYPTGIDTDVEIPRVDDNISEIGGEAINSLRSAVFAIEKALGIQPQGSAADLVSRLGTSLDNNGNIKASALSGIGLVTLPITNAQVGTNAGIDESKLRLNYGTTLLKSWIDSLTVRVDALEAAVAQDIANLAQHVGHPSVFGRHNAGDVDAYGVFAGRNVQGALTNLDTRLNAHVSDPVGAHAGSAISLDSSRFAALTATDVQTAVEQLESIQLVEIIAHRNLQHGNGVLAEQDVARAGTGLPVVIVPASLAQAITAGDTAVRFQVAPPGLVFGAIARNDRLDLNVGGHIHTFVVSSTSGTDTVNIFGFVPVSTGSATIAVYRNPQETSEPSVAMVAVRQGVVGTRPTVLQLIHPSAPFILSNGFNGGSMPTSARFRVAFSGGVHGGVTDDLDIGSAMSALLVGTPSRWTVDVVAETINSRLFAAAGSATHHYPLVAFSYLGELGIALDNPDADGYVQILAPLVGTSALPYLGLTQDSIAYNSGPRRLYIDGYEVTGVHKLLDAYGTSTGGGTISIPGIDPAGLGLKTGSIVRVARSGGVQHPICPDDGTYVLASVAAGTLTFDTTSEHIFAVGTSFRVQAYADTVAPSIPLPARTLYELCLDGYLGLASRPADFIPSVRVTYSNSVGSSLSLADRIDIVDVSRTYSATSRRLRWNSATLSFDLGTPAAGPSITQPGTAVVVPGATTGVERGFRARIYDVNNVDYIEIAVVDTLPSPGTGYLDVTILNPIGEEKFLQVGTVLHDTTKFKWLDDRRLFGTVGRREVRDDFARDYISYPTSLLRGCGVVRGFLASGLFTTALTLAGGEVLVDGKIKSIPQKLISMPADASSDTVYNLFVDRDGVTRLWLDGYDDSLAFSTPTLGELLTSGTETALWQVTVDSVTRIILNLTDVRRFVNSIDDKLDLLVEENAITNGSFASLTAAVAYLNSLPSGSPVSRSIRIRGEVLLSGAVTLPSHVSLLGDGYGPGTKGSRLTYTSSSATIIPGDGTSVRDLAFYRSGTLSPGFISGANISNARIENCGFEFASLAADNSAISCGTLNNSKIMGCVFTNDGYGVHVIAGGLNVQIVGNIFNGLNAVIVNSPNPFALGANNFLVAENLFGTLADFSVVDALALVRLDNPWGVVIRDNLFTSASPAAATREMLHFHGTSFACAIKNNVFGNSGSGIGFEKAIWFDGTAALPHSNDTIENNGFLSFRGGAAGQKTILLHNVTGTVVSNNVTLFCRTPLEITESSWTTVDRNFFPSIEDYPAINILAPNMGEHFIITNNFITNPDVITNRIVVLQTMAAVSLFSTGVGGLFCGNTVQYSAIVPFLNTQKAALYVDGQEWFVLNNEVGCVFAGAFFGLESPITLTANAGRSMVTQNNLIHAILFGPAAAISVAGGASQVYENLNRGQTYSVTIPVSWAKESRMEDGSSSWQSVTLGFNATNVTYDASAPDIVFAFGESVVPAGAIVDSVEVLYNLSGGDASKLQMAWYLERGFPSALTTIHVLGNVGFADGAAHVETLSPTTTPAPIYMRRGDTHRLSLVLAAGGAWTATIYEFRVNFTL